MERQIKIDTTIDRRTFRALTDAIEYEIADIDQEMETMEGDLLEQWKHERDKLWEAFQLLLEGAEEVES